MEKVITTLRKLGLNKYESMAYLALVSLGVSTAGKLAEKSSIPRAKIYEVLRSLEKQGFAVSTSTRPSKFKPVELDDVVSKIQQNARSDYESRLEQVSEVHKELREDLKGIERDSSEEEMVWILRGRSNIYNAIDKLVDESQKRLIAATTEKGVVRKLFRHKDKLKDAAKRGVDVRLLAPITRANAQVVKDSVENFILNHGNSVSARFVLSDDQKGVVILHGDEDGKSQHNETGLLVNSPYFVRALGHYFDQKWNNTMPLNERLGELGVGA